MMWSCTKLCSVALESTTPSRRCLLEAGDARARVRVGIPLARARATAAPVGRRGRAVLRRVLEPDELESVAGGGLEAHHGIALEYEVDANRVADHIVGLVD